MSADRKARATPASTPSANRPAHARDGGDGGHRRRFPLKRAVFLTLGAVGLYLVWPSLVAVFLQAPRLASIAWFWFLLMLILETASFACYWGLLRVTVNTTSWFLAATTQLASNAFSRVVPGGAAAGGSVSFQLLTGRGYPRARVFTSLTATTLISNAVLLAMPALSLPAILSGLVDRTLLRTAEIGGLAFVLILAAGVTVLFTDAPLELVGRGIQRVRNAARRQRRPLESLPEKLLLERDLIRSVLGRRWWQALLYAAGNWLFDWGALLAALAAVGARPRASVVLVAYVVAALLGMLPFTPGGLGFVEVGLTAALPLAGVRPADAILATLAYRLVSYWLPIPVGLVALALYRRRFRAPTSARLS